MDKSSFVIVGRIGAPYGVKGWHHIHSDTAPLDNILKYSNWFLNRNGSWDPFKVVASRVQNKGVVALLNGVQDRDEAALLTNCLIGVPREALAPIQDEEFYWVDLEGLTVATLEGTCLGTVHYLYENAGIDVMVVVDGEKEQHIPFLLNDTVISVDYAMKKIYVNWEPVR